jgi:hypothetical protein
MDPEWHSRRAQQLARLSIILASISLGLLTLVLVVNVLIAVLLPGHPTYCVSLHLNPVRCR